MQHCPCGSSKKYDLCCGPFLEGLQAPATPEQLMRSRYTAFTKADTKHLVNTMRGKPLEAFDAKGTKAWAEAVSWLGLTVLKAPIPEEDIGTVEFIARFKENGKECAIHEVSIFHKIEGRWFYVEGNHLD